MVEAAAAAFKASFLEWEQALLKSHRSKEQADNDKAMSSARNLNDATVHFHGSISSLQGSKNEQEGASNMAQRRLEQVCLSLTHECFIDIQTLYVMYLLHVLVRVILFVLICSRMLQSMHARWPGAQPPDIGARRSPTPQLLDGDDDDDEDEAIFIPLEEMMGDSDEDEDEDDSQKSYHRSLASQNCRKAQNPVRAASCQPLKSRPRFPRRAVSRWASIATHQMVTTPSRRRSN